MAKLLASGVELAQWKVETHKTMILTSEEMERYVVCKWESSFDGCDRLQEDLAAPLLPEMVFGHNFARFTHTPSGLILEFNAKESLHAWAKCCQGITVSVAHSEGWSEHRREMVQSSPPRSLRC
jgi:hypothetical protein